MKFVKNKKGFTLVELVVGTAILGIIGLTTAMLMTSGTNMYRNVHRGSTVLFKSQVAATQLQEAIVDCKYPFSVYADSLFICDKAAEGEENEFTIHIYKYDEALHEIDLVDHKYTFTGDVISKSDSADEAIPFCFNVGSIQYTPQYSSADGNMAYALKFDLVIQKFGLDYTRNEILSLRNHPTLVRGASAGDTEAKLAQEMVAVLNSEKED